MTEASNEYVIMGNSALMRCVIPSFVSDFVSVQNWQDETGNVLVSDNNNYGTKYKHRRYFPIWPMICLISLSVVLVHTLDVSKY